MNNSIIYLFFSVFVLIQGVLFDNNAEASGVDDLQLITEDYAPLNFEKDGKIQGFTVDLLVEMLHRSGSTKTREEINVMPWTDGYRITQNQKNTVLFSTSRTEARETLFKWVGPIFSGYDAVIAKKSRNIRIDSTNDLNKYIIGVVRDDIAEQLLLEAGVKPNNIYQTISGTGGQNLGKMLAGERVDLWAYGEITAFWNLMESGFSSSDFEVVYYLKKTDVYYALNREIDDEIVTKLQNALDEIKATGELQKIIKKYLPSYNDEH
jgi:polar amino acid transport system substrate-binding protein